MFDQDNYQSDEGENVMYSSKHMGQSILTSSQANFNHLTGEGQNLLQLMKDRGFDLTDNEVKKMQNRREFKSKDKQSSKNKQKAGFYDGGNSATLQQLIKALNKAFSKADPQQASCILSYILEKKNITPEDKNKFGIMKCNLLYALGAYEQSLDRSKEMMEKPISQLSAAIFSNLIAKSRLQLNHIFEGYFDLLRAKSFINEYKQEIETNKIEKEENTTKQQSQSTQQQQQFKDTQLDTIIREINHSQLQYNIKLTEVKNSNNLVHPHFPQFRQRNVKQVVCGDYHALFLVGFPLYCKSQVQYDHNWQNEVFGVGQNTVGQITGFSNPNIIKQPLLISYFSGKGIEGIWATRQSSLAYDIKGNIYEWGIKENRNEKINITFKIGERIKHLEKGYRNYAALTQSKSFYSWGVINYKQTTNIYNKTTPHLTQLKNIVSFSCGKGHIIALDDKGEGYALGDNEHGQLGLEGDLYTKDYKIINRDKMMGDIRKVYCLADCTFFVNSYEEVFLVGKYSYNKNAQLKIKQAQFYNDPLHVVNISGTIGNYYLSDSFGNLHRWDVDSSVKFKVNMDEKVTQRYIAVSRGIVYRIKSIVEPTLCTVRKLTQSPKTFEPIEYLITLKDSFGPYGNQLFYPLHCQVFLSTFKANPQNVLKENQLYLEAAQQNKQQKGIIISQIMESRMMQLSIKRLEEQNFNFNLTFMTERAGRYFFYVLIESQLIHTQQFVIQVSDRERQLEEKTKIDRQLKQEQRRKRAEMERQRLLDEKLKKEEEEQERRRQTQRRAQQTLRKHMRQQQQQRIKIEQQRKRKQQLQTGGGFDLSKLRKNSMEKSGQSFLPNINVRPSSKRKVNLPKAVDLISPSSKIQKPKQFLNEIATSSSYNSGFQSQKTQKRQKSKPMIGQNIANLTNTGISGITTTSRPIVKRGLSKGKKN